MAPEPPNNEDVGKVTSFSFPGFRFPNYTQVPNEVFDDLLPILSGAELKVLLYICRRTFGFHKNTDNISLNQMLNGLQSTNGKPLDGGTGLSKPTLLKALRDLQDKGVIEATRRSSNEKGDEPTNYRLRFVSDGRTPKTEKNATQEDDEDEPEGGELKNLIPPGKKTLPGGGKKTLPPPVVKKFNPQKKANKQKKEKGNKDRSAPNGVKSESPEPLNAACIAGPFLDEMIVTLMEEGVHQRVAMQLVQNFARERIQEKIKYVDYLKMCGKVERPAGWLKCAIEDDYQAPEGYATYVKAQMTSAEETTPQEVDGSSSFWTDLEAQEEEQRHLKQTAIVALRGGSPLTDEEQQLWRNMKMFLPPSQLEKAVVDSLDLVRVDGDQVTVAISDQYGFTQTTHPGVKKVIERSFAIALNLKRVTVSIVRL